MNPVRKVVRIRRRAEHLLEARDVDDMLDVFAMQDAEVVRVDVNVPEGPRSGLRRKVDVQDIEELSDGITEGWDDDVA